MCTDSFVSSLRISEIFTQEGRVAEILQYRKGRDAGKYPLSSCPRKKSGQVFSI